MQKSKNKYFWKRGFKFFSGWYRQLLPWQIMYFSNLKERKKYYTVIMVTCIQIIYSNDSKHKLIKKRKFFLWWLWWRWWFFYLVMFVRVLIFHYEFMLNVRIMVIILILVAMTIIIMMKLVVINIYFLYIFFYLKHN